MEYFIIIVLIIAALVLGMFVIPQWRMKRNIRKVVRIFREHNATSAKEAKTIIELGLRPRNMIDKMLLGRDYRQYALDALINFGIVLATEEGKLYLSEEVLSQTPFAKDTSYPYQGIG